jgi:hypothetical protein
MTKMGKTQRIAILDFHNGVTAKGHTMIGNLRAMNAMERNGWVRTIGTGRAAYVTTAGLIAAGVDMDAIHAEALVEDSGGEWRRPCRATRKPSRVRSADRR